uniref:NADH dehydrogenase subunit 1 n=1 Tax=Rhynchospio aff. asiatica ZW-2021 TaxID=2813871 RepID=UPI0023AAB209|nr:NADH dehydrogenase subunit 1 [Rhynchospio aff. asiatica ZW-2021]WCI21132.1 NADH dehydrogenase subunit 1 [Rhynchospio aff. asiatica ZW-2021]
MPTSFIPVVLIIYMLILLAMAFFTLLERKLIGYIQIRKGPNKVGVMGLPQPFADALKLFTKEHAHPTMANMAPFYTAPTLSLILALTLWSLYPSGSPSVIMSFSILFFLAVSSLSVYATLTAGWASNSKYALLGALRGIAQTISYEVSMALVLLAALMISQIYNFVDSSFHSLSWAALIFPPIFMIWFITMLAETNRTPFDLAEGESELVSGFNTEYSSGPFALIFMAEYTSILAMSMFSSTIFSTQFPLTMLGDLFTTLKTLMLASLFIWVRATLPRMRYDHLMDLTWKTFLPFILAALMILLTLIIL